MTRQRNVARLGRPHAKIAKDGKKNLFSRSLRPWRPLREAVYILYVNRAYNWRRYSTSSRTPKPVPPTGA